MIYFGGDSFMYGQPIKDAGGHDSFDRKNAVPQRVQKLLNTPVCDDAQVSSSNKLIYLRALTNILSDESCDYYVIMWSRGVDRRLEHIMDYDLKERWINIIPCANHEKDDKIRNDINKLVLKHLVTDESSFLNNLIFMVSFQEILKKYNKRYIFCYAHNEFLELYKRYQYGFELDVKDDIEDFTKITNLKPLVDSLDSKNILSKSFTEFVNVENPNIHPNRHECKEFTMYLLEEIKDEIKRR